MVVGEGGEGIHKDPPESVRIGQDRSGSVRISGARAQVPREWRAYVTQGLNCFLNSTLGALWNNQMGFLSIMYQTWFLLLRHFISSLLPPPPPSPPPPPPPPPLLHLCRLLLRLRFFWGSSPLSSNNYFKSWPSCGIEDHSQVRTEPFLLLLLLLLFLFPSVNPKHPPGLQDRTD